MSLIITQAGSRNAFQARVEQVKMTARVLVLHKQNNDHDGFTNSCAAIGIIGDITIPAAEYLWYTADPNATEGVAGMCNEKKREVRGKHMPLSWLDDTSSMELGSVTIPLVEFYWHAMSGKPAEDIAIALPTCNKPADVARALGIDVQNSTAPAAELLYHLCSLEFDEHFEYSIRHGRHFGGRSGRERNERRVLLTDSSRGCPWSIGWATLFNGSTPGDFIDQRIDKKSQPLRQSLGEDLGRSFAEMCFECDIILPNTRVAGQLKPLFQRARAGERIVIAGDFCPDYSYIENPGDPVLKYRYTFESVGTGVGLVALGFQRVIGPMHEFFRNHGIDHLFQFGIGDFEADSQDTLRRVKEDYDSFVAKCQRSLEAFRDSVSNDLPLTLGLCDRDFCEPGQFRQLQEQATERMLNGDFGRMADQHDDPAAVALEIANESATFYRRWYGNISTEEILKKVLYQGGEYAALAEIHRQEHGNENLLILSGDRPKMHWFDDFYRVSPTICMKRVY